MQTLLAPLALSLLVIAVGCLVLWAIGRPADGHPLCRRCRFDLIGTPAAAVCPECGADLARRRAVRLNRRRRLWPLLALGLVMLVAAGAAAFPMAQTQLARVDWDRHKPSWWLLRETRSTHPAIVGTALRELLERYEAGTLPHDSVLALAEQGLAYRDNAAPSGMWNFEYGNFIDIAWQHGLLSASQKDAYTRGAFALSWSGPHQRRLEGAPPNPTLFVRVTPFVGHPLLSSASPPPVDFDLFELVASVNGTPAEVEIRSRPGRFDPARNLYETALASAFVELPMEPEDAKLELRWTLQTVDMRTHEPIGEPWTGSRTLTLDRPIDGGARPQDDRPTPDISRY